MQCFAIDFWVVGSSQHCKNISRAIGYQTVYCGIRTIVCKYCKNRFTNYLAKDEAFNYSRAQHDTVVGPDTPLMPLSQAIPKCFWKLIDEQTRSTHKNTGLTRTLLLPFSTFFPLIKFEIHPLSFQIRNGIETWSLCQHYITRLH